jgi:hypothetical protein
MALIASLRQLAICISEDEAFLPSAFFYVTLLGR